MFSTSTIFRTQKQITINPINKYYYYTVYFQQGRTINKKLRNLNKHQFYVKIQIEPNIKCNITQAIII